MTPTSLTKNGSDLEGERRFSMAGRFIEGLAARNFAHLASALADGVVLQALLPRGPDRYDGSDAVSAAFDGWFGHATEFEVLDVSIGEVIDRLHLCWRVRLRAADGRYVIEQQAYANTDANGRIARIDLLCSGFRPEARDG